MNIIGFNLEKTSYGLPLDNGGACLVVDGKVKMMINEERLYREQYRPGFELSINYLLENNRFSLKNIDLFVASSCLDVLPGRKEVQKQLAVRGFNVPVSKIRVCDHHLSHAHTAFYPSPFEKAIVMILDGDGNVLAKRMTPRTRTRTKYWLNKFEHNSYYVGEGSRITFLERDQINAGENGFGGAYRYFTYFCGFPGYKYAGKLMGLSAYGAKRNRYKNVRVFDLLPDGKIKCLLPDSDRLHSPEVVERWLKDRGVYVKARKPSEKITETIEDIAFLIQRELDRALIHKVKYLVKKTGIKNLCIAGGVGLNAVTNRALLDHTGIEHIYIQPAAGDSGQCLGNALYGAHKFDGMHAKRAPLSVYQGKEYSDEEITRAFEDEKSISWKRMEFSDLAKIAAEKIAAGKIVAWYQGKSEIGPRALGNRSILADPRNLHMKRILNSRVKHRESFRPFAPSVLEEEAAKWFGINIPAPYMIMNAQVNRGKMKRIPAVTHRDSSARLQTVNSKDNPRYYRLIAEFQKITGIPVVLNTSFNDNESIPETPRDAVNTFLRTGIDYLVIGDYFVEKSAHFTNRERRFEAIQNEWSSIAEQTKKIQTAKSKVLNGVFLRLVKTYAKPGAAVFDYHAEWGEYADLLARNHYRVWALNESDAMVKDARKKFKKPIFYTRKEFYKNLPILENKFDLVYSNLWLCITEISQHGALIENFKKLLKNDGTIVVSFCHPSFDYMRESIVTSRDIPDGGVRYDREFKYRKVVHENGLEFDDYHRPLEYYISLFKKHDLKILDIAESDILNTNFYPDFIMFALKKSRPQK